MGYYQENYRRIRTAYQTKYLAAYEEAERRTKEVHARSAEIAAIDAELSRTLSEIALAALGTGEEYREKLAAVEAHNMELQTRRATLLHALGYPADYTRPPFQCEKCQDTGFVGTKMCDCMRGELTEAAFAASGMGDLVRTQCFENFSLDYYRDDPAVYELMGKHLGFLKNYAETFTLDAGNVLLCGNTGLGKTHLSTAVARRVIERGYDVFYISALNMISSFEQLKFHNGIMGDNAVDTARLSDCELLILDDLGVELANQFSASCLYMVLNNRLNLHRPTIINTNLTGKDIRERYDDRIASRIFGEFQALPFRGIDIRRQKLGRK